MTVKFGIIGAGMIGFDHARRITKVLKGAEVVAINDVNKDNAQRINQDLGIQASIYDDPYALINDDNVDVIMVTSIGSTHEEFVLAPIKAGKAVFCEKPLATTAKGCKNIVDAEMKAGKRLVQVGFMRRYDRSYRQLKKTLDDKVIGAPLILHCSHRNAKVDERFANDMHIQDAFVHELDVLRWLLDENYISAQVILPRCTRHSHDKLHDPQIFLLETESGVRIDVEIFVNCQYGYDIQTEVIGEDSTVKLPQPQSVLSKNKFSEESRVAEDWRERFIEAYDTEIQEFIDSVEQDNIVGPSSWDGYIVSICSDIFLEAKKSSAIEKINLPETPAFYQ